MKNSYAADPKEIPATDIYAGVPFYARYFPTPDDFQVDAQHVNSQSAASRVYWASVLELCQDSNRIYPADAGGRDVFALGSVIVKSSHLHDAKDDKASEIDYSYADANEVAAVALAKSALKDIRVPEIYFAGRINGLQVLIQERLPGAREVLQRLHAIKPTDGRRARDHVVRDPGILTNGRIRTMEADILYSAISADQDLGFMHNDFTKSNCIVDNDRIVGLIDWEMAGFFGWKTAGEIHRRIRTPQREHFANAKVSKEKLQDIISWGDIYGEGEGE